MIEKLKHIGFQLKMVMSVLTNSKSYYTYTNFFYYRTDQVVRFDLSYGFGESGKLSHFCAR